MARPARRSQRGSPYERLTRWAPIRSAHSGWIVATRRAHTRLVSTSSAAITHRGGRLASTDPGAMTNVAPRAPRNSRGSRSRKPRCDSSPASTDWWTWSGWPAVSDRQRPNAEVAGDPAELAEQVLPLAHAQVVEVLGPAQLAELVGRQLPLLGAQVVPQGDDRQQVRAGDVEPAVGRVGLGALGDRTFSRILDRQRGGDDEHLAHAPEAVGFEHHPAEPGIDRQAGQPPADRRQRANAVAVGRADRGELLEQQVAVADGSRVGRLRRTGRRRRRRARSPSSAG